MVARRRGVLEVRATRGHFNNPKFSDFLIRTASQEFRVHKVILSCASPYFRRMLENDWKETALNSVELQGDEAIAVEAMLRYIYDLDHNIIDKSEGGPTQQAIFNSHLYAVADKYEVFQLGWETLVEFRALINVVCKNHGPAEVVIAIYRLEAIPKPLTRVLCESVNDNLARLMEQDDFVDALKMFPQFPLDMMEYLSTL